MRRLVSIVIVAAGCAVNPNPEPDAATDVVRTVVAPGQAVDLTHQTVIQTQEYPATRDQVWGALLASEEDLAMQLHSVDSARGVVVYRLQATSPRIAGRHPSTWLDCGRGPDGGPRVNTYQLTLRMTVVVEPVAERHTRVQTALVGSAHDRGVSGDGLPCTSSGQLEKRALAILAARLAS
ncbi:MAG TPA: hypothetical protein VH833_02605 [Gemmatimonadales bacterium]|jgi:hypothetical protein